MCLCPTSPDVDECTESPAVCDGQGVCENTLGSFKCICRPGYRGNGTHCEGKQLLLTSLHGKSVLPVDRDQIQCVRVF